MGDETADEITVTGIFNKATATGDHVIELRMPDGSVKTGLVPLEAARALLSVLSPAVLADAAQTAQRMTLPTADLCGLSIVHHGPTAELLIDTKEIGRLVLLMSDEWLAEALEFLRRIQSSRRDSKKIQ
jgi:hypothetical protein